MIVGGHLLTQLTLRDPDQRALDAIHGAGRQDDETAEGRSTSHQAEELAEIVPDEVALVGAFR